MSSHYELIGGLTVAQVVKPCARVVTRVYLSCCYYVGLLAVMYANVADEIETLNCTQHEAWGPGVSLVSSFLHKLILAQTTHIKFQKVGKFYCIIATCKITFPWNLSMIVVD